MSKLLQKIIWAYPPLHLMVQILMNRVGAVKSSNLKLVYDQFKQENNEDTVALDLGCGFNPRNHFSAKFFYGVDLYDDIDRNIYKSRLGFEPLPFDDNHFDYITADNILEHIPRYAELPEYGNAPFIFLMNEIYRVLKKNGIFMSITPIYPYLGAFQDPTHTNIMTVETFRLYFSNQKYEIAKHYGIKCDYEILYQKMLGQYLVAVMKK